VSGLSLIAKIRKNGGWQMAAGFSSVTKPILRIFNKNLEIIFFITSFDFNMA